MFLSGRCLVLALGSPRRRELLARLVEQFEVVVSGVPEPVDTTKTPAENVLDIARAKASAVRSIVGECLVLAADTDVVLDGEILGKPRDALDARGMLRRLDGRAHDVLTAIVLVESLSGDQWEDVVHSHVTIRRLTDREIDTYVATGEPLDKAGGYAIQGDAARMVDSVSGCYTNVIGLPLCAAARLLAAGGWEAGKGRTCPGPDERTGHCAWR